MKNVVWKGNTEITTVKENSLTVMEYHANKQIESLQIHANLLIEQAQEIKDRVDLSYKIAEAKYNFTPVHLKVYYLYEDEHNLTLTLIAPDEWDSPYGKFIGAVRQLGDSTWEKVSMPEQELLRESDVDADFEKCVRCSKTTSTKKTEHIDHRRGYLQGAGQLCTECYNNLYKR